MNVDSIIIVALVLVAVTAWISDSILREDVKKLEEDRREDRRKQLAMDGSLTSVLRWIARHDGKGLVQRYPGSDPIVEYGPHIQSPPVFLSKDDDPARYNAPTILRSGDAVEILYDKNFISDMEKYLSMDKIKEMIERRVELVTRGLVDQVLIVKNTHKEIQEDIHGIKQQIDYFENFGPWVKENPAEEDEQAGHS